MPLVPTLAFLGLLAILLFIDLAVLNRKAHVVSASEAFRQTGIWVAVALAFAGVIFFLYDKHHFGLGLADHALTHSTSTQPHADPLTGAPTPTPTPASTPPNPDHTDPTPTVPTVPTDPAAPAGPIATGVDTAPKALDPLLPHNGKEAAAMFAMGYLLELMLSLDNMMVIAIIMTYFKVPHAYQHRVLFWGIIGAVLLRGAMIGAGSALIHNFDWLLYVFGGFLVFTAVKLLFDKEDQAPDLEKNFAVRLARSMFVVAPGYDGQKFFTVHNGARAITPLMLALIAIEFADVVFAVDSIPAIFSTTKDPFIVLTSNCFAILGLRTMFFAVTAITRKFPYLKQSMILILAFIGMKMLVPLLKLIPDIRNAAPDWDFHVRPLISLPVIAVLMIGGVAASLLFPREPEEDLHSTPPAH